MVLLLSLVSGRPLSLAQRFASQAPPSYGSPMDFQHERDWIRARSPKGVAAFVCVTCPANRASSCAGRGLGSLGVAADSRTPLTDWSIGEPSSVGLTMRQSVTGIT